MVLSNSVKKRFVKDFRLPIDILREPYFSEKIKYLDKEFDSIAKLELLKETINSLGSEDAFFNEGDRIVSELQEQIRNNEEYKNLQNDRLEREGQYVKDIKIKYQTKRDFYKEENLNKVYISIDLVEANFNALKSKNIFKEKNFREVLNKFTTFEYFLKSKHIRQIVFGSLLPKKQIIIEEYAVAKILDSLNVDFTNVVLNKDEIILEVSDDLNFNHLEILEELQKINTDFPLRIERFNLIELRDKNENLYFVKDYGYELKLKSVPKVYYTQAYKKLMKQEIEESDLMFFYEGQVAYFKESIF